MSVQKQIDRIKSERAAIAHTITDKGVNVPFSAKLADMPAYISQIHDKGDPGEAATIEIGTVVSGTTASVVNVGTPAHAILNFVLPKGDKGDDYDYQGGFDYL